MRTVLGAGRSRELVRARSAADVNSVAERRGVRQADSGSRDEFGLLARWQRLGFDPGRPVPGDLSCKQAKQARPGPDPAHPPCVRAGSGPGRSESVESEIWRMGEGARSEVTVGRGEADCVAIWRSRVSEKAMASRGGDGVSGEGC
jgi:hypothetical protein